MFDEVYNDFGSDMSKVGDAAITGLIIAGIPVILRSRLRVVLLLPLSAEIWNVQFVGDGRIVIEVFRKNAKISNIEIQVNKAILFNRMESRPHSFSQLRIFR